jgi:glycosyltransferase involved in cell wall biosynthesis
MRVMMVISGLAVGGAERQVVLLSRELARRGHAVLIYTLNDHVPRRAELAGSAVELIVDQKRWRLDPLLVRRLRRTVRQWQPDIVHGFLFDGDLYSRLACWGLGLPVLNSERSNSHALSLQQRWGYRLTGALADGVVANSHAAAAMAGLRHGVGQGCVHVVWNGIDLAEIDARLARSTQPARQVVPQADAKLGCVVGMIKTQKDHPLALEVCRELLARDPRWRFLFIGDRVEDDGDACKREVFAMWRRLGLEQAVVFTGVRRDVPEVVASCDVLLMTSRLEGFPNAVLEAMACGTPVASTDYSDVRRILPFDWQVAATRSARELADIVQRCERERDAVSAAQRRWVEAHADVARAADALLAVYRGYLRAPLGAAPAEPAR